MLPIVWSVNADDDLGEIILFVGERNPLAAEKLWHLLHDSVLHSRQQFPYGERVASL